MQNNTFCHSALACPNESGGYGIYNRLKISIDDCVTIDVVAQFIGLIMILSTSRINEATTIVAKNGVVTQSVRRNDDKVKKAILQKSIIFL